MPVRKQEAYRALELLEEYYNRLDSPEDRPLKLAIDRVIKVFKSRLFQALIDIQEFYESVLLDEQTDRESKMNAVHHFADEWEQQPMLKRDIQKGASVKNESSTVANIVTENPIAAPSHTKDNIKREATPTPFSQLIHVPDSTNHQNPSGLNPPTNLTQFNYDNHWEEKEIILKRLPGEGLGFSIAGGTDMPCINDSSAVVVTRITKEGLADRDKRLRLHDIILRVNDKDFTNIEHQAAVDYLKSTANEVKLLIRRLSPPSVEEIKLDKSHENQLGFSIAGGITHEHVKGDHGIFITNIIKNGIADKNGRLKVGDRLMAVQSMKNTYDLEFVEHRYAVESIRRACEEGNKLVLIVGHPASQSSDTLIRPITSSTPINQINGHQSPSNEEQEESSTGRRVLLQRGTNGFGFSVIGDETENGLFISFIQSGGPADKSGELHKGDQILSVNNIDLRKLSYNDAASVLKNCGETANIHVISNLNDFARFEKRNEERRKNMSSDIAGSTGSLKISTKRQFFVRALFDYEPANDPSLPTGSGLAFRIGDILNVTNAADDSWWQAKRIANRPQEEDKTGIIPSKSRIEKKERARQKHVNFNQGSSSRSNTLDREKKKKKKLFSFNKSADRKDAQSGEESDNELDNIEPIQSYELVTQHEIDYARPIIIFGPFKEVLIDQLLNDQPDKFANCVPHTSRPKRENEIEGREYYFIPTREHMERDIKNSLFIEAGEYGGNLYGTSVNVIRQLANSSKHCVLDVSGRAIRRLIMAGLYPIVIYVKPRDIKWILDNMGEEVNEEHAQQIFDKSNAIEQEFGDLFTVTIEAETLSDVYERMCEVIDVEQDALRHTWIPSTEKL